MIKRITALGSVLLLSALPVWVGALGLGNIDLKSGLNQPLEARIPLSSLQAGDLESLHVGLAAPEHFQRAGVDRPFFLAKLKFSAQTGTDGTSFIRVSSRQQVSEPFLNFLVEVSWPRGRVIREYTLLLDPPVYGAAISRAVKTTVAAVAKAPAVASKPLSPAAAPVVAATPAASSAAVPVATGGSYGPTTRKDTLWSLARRFRGDPTVSIQQMMLAILGANPEAFSKNNINTLRAGVVLRVPGNSDVEALSKREALAEVKRQEIEWREMRQGQAARVAKAPVGKPVAGGQGVAKNGVEAKADEARLKLLSAGQGAGAGTAAKPVADVAVLRDELNVALEDADTKRVENENLQTRLAEADALIADLKRLVELKDDNISALQNNIAESSTAVAVAEAAPPLKVAAVDPATPDSPPETFLDTLRDALPVDPVLLGGGIGLLLLLVGASSWLRRRRAGSAVAETVAEPVSSGDVTELAGFEEEPEVAEAEVPAVTDELAEVTEAEAEESAPVAEAATEEDPLAEVNVYLAYERFDQAEDLVRGAVEKYPERHEYKLKLLEIFCAARSVEAFETTAMALQEAVGADHALMEKAHAWWAELSPERALFAPLSEETPAEFSETHVGDADNEAVFDVTEGDEVAEGMSDTVKMDSTDFDLGFGEESEAVEGTEESLAAATNSDLDFDLGFGEEAEDGGQDTAEQDPVGSDSVVDFDLGFEMDAGEAEDSAAEASLPGSDSDVDFDLGAASDESLEIATAATDDEGLDVVLGEAEGDGSISLDDEPVAEVLEVEAAEVAGDVEGGLLDTVVLDEAEDTNESGAEDETTEVVELEPDSDFAALFEEEAPAGDTGPDDEPVAESLEVEASEVTEFDGGLDLVLDEVESTSESGLEDETAEAEELETDSDFAALFEEEAPAEDTGLDFDLGEGSEVADTIVMEVPMEVDEPMVSADDTAVAGELPEVDDDLAALFESDEESAPVSDEVTAAAPESEEAGAEDDGLASLFDVESSDDGDDSLELEPDVADSEGETDTDFGALSEEDSPAEDSALDLDLSEADDKGEDASADFESTQYALQDAPAADTASVSADEDLSIPMDETQAKLDLAQAYVDSDDQEGGRGILEEILAEGNETQKQEAQALLDQMAGG